jgi:SAM-dependent methyltransferase
MDSVQRFHDRALDYVKYRPTYPAEAVLAIVDGLGPPERLLAADVGAGTGISARLLAERGVRVVAVEPGEAMRLAATPAANVTWVGGMAEATGLRDASVDLVLSAQSFHWFHPADALREFARILQPGGRLAIMWNRRSRDDPFTVGYRQVLLDVGAEARAERMSFDPDVIRQCELFSPAERLTFSNTQRLDLDGLIGRARSTSYAPKDGARGEELLSRLRELHARYADARGIATMIYETEIYRAYSTTLPLVTKRR